MKLSAKIGMITLLPATLLVNAGVNKVADTKIDEKDIPTYYWDKNASTQTSIVNNTETTQKKAKGLADKGSEYPKTMAFLTMLGLIARKGARKLEEYKEEMLIKEAKREEINKKNDSAGEYVNDFIARIPNDVKAKLTEEENQALANVNEQFALEGNKEQLDKLVALIKDKSDNEMIATEKTYKLLARLVYTQETDIRKKLETGQEIKNQIYPINLSDVVEDLQRIKSPYFTDIIEQHPIFMCKVTKDNITSMCPNIISREQHGKYLFDKLINGHSNNVINDTKNMLEVFENENKINKDTLEYDYELHRYDFDKIIKYLSQLPDDLKSKMIAEDKVFGDKQFAAALLNKFFPKQSIEINNKFKENALNRFNELKGILLTLTKNPNISFSIFMHGNERIDSNRPFHNMQPKELLEKIEKWISDDYDYITAVGIYDFNNKREYNSLYTTFKELESQLDNRKEQYKVHYMEDRLESERGGDYLYHTYDAIGIHLNYDMSMFNAPKYKHESLYNIKLEKEKE